jgi:16S rRNA (cytosine967-C5)-methyltransferase
VTPGARLAAVIELLEAFEAGEAPADRLVAAWGRRSRFAGSKDRAAVADRFYDCLRRRRSLAWAAGGESARAAVIGAVLAEGGDPAALFTGEGHAPPPLDAPERAALGAPRPAPPDPVRLDYPDWLDGALRAGLGGRFEAAMAALGRRAPLDLRVNRLKATVAEARAALAAEGIEAAPAPHAPHGLRAAAGAPVAASRAFAEGLIEPQDAASQAAAALAAARPGETVLDFCAGGGGKTLALAAEMANRGRLIAHDADPGRMRDLPSRAARAGARVETAIPGGLAGLAGRCDLVVVDAPCSGSGAWRRDPGAKWRLTPARLAALAELQPRLIVEAATFVRPGGRLLYATCSLLAAENGEALARALPALAGRSPARRATLTLTPDLGADGFFAALIALAA